MDEQHIQALAAIDSLWDWRQYAKGKVFENKPEVFKRAQSQWLERMIRSYKLMINPKIAREIYEAGWEASDLHIRMIWASDLAVRNDKSKSTFNQVKRHLRKKYGHDWWEDVYWRIKPAYAAISRIRKIESENDAIKFGAENGSSFFAGLIADQYQSALKGIPAE